MEQSTETKTTNEKHVCAHGTDSHCCSCAGCGAGWNHHRHMRRWFALVIGVLLAFFVGMKLGEMKGLIWAQYGMMPGHHQVNPDQGWDLRNRL